MDQTEKLLEATCKSARMGAQSIGAVLPKTRDQNMRGLLMQDLTQLDDIAHRASEELVRRGIEEKEGVSEKVSDFMVQLKAGMNQTPGALAEMLVNGAAMGIVELHRAKNAAPTAEPVAHQLCEETSGVVSRITEEMKAFL